jgi:hypothetical protein
MQLQILNTSKATCAQAQAAVHTSASINRRNQQSAEVSQGRSYGGMQQPTDVAASVAVGMVGGLMDLGRLGLGYAHCN